MSIHLRHRDRIAGVEDDDGVRICFLDGLDQLILTGGEVHRLDVEAFGLVLVVAADDHHRDVGFCGAVCRLLSDRLRALRRCRARDLRLPCRRRAQR